MRTIGLIRVNLVLQSPGGVTAPEAGPVIDLPLRRGRNGTIWLPPSSLAGSLRAHLGNRAEQFLGAQPPTGRGDDRPLQPSPVRFLGTRTTVPAENGIETRSSTAIDPQRAAAVPATLRTRELLPAGTEITLYLRYDERADLRSQLEPSSVPDYDLDGFVDLLQSWQPRIGRGRTSGHGLAYIRRIAARSLDLTTTAGLTAWLSAGPEELFPDADTGWNTIRHPARNDETPVLSAEFITTDALHIGSGSERKIMCSSGRPVIPSTTWKGLLRARCGYILRSCGRPACLAPARRDDGQHEPACQACHLCHLFGWTAASRGHNTPVGRAGELTFHDSDLTGQLGNRHHVGIDRFTGGARRHLLYTDPVITNGHTTLRITMTRPGCALSAADRGLLLLAIRDLHDGLIGIGRSTTRGYGTLRLTATSLPLLNELHPSHNTGAAVRAMLEGAG